MGSSSFESNGTNQFTQNFSHQYLQAQPATGAVVIPVNQQGFSGVSYLAMKNMAAANDVGKGKGNGGGRGEDGKLTDENNVMGNFGGLRANGGKEDNIIRNNMNGLNKNSSVNEKMIMDLNSVDNSTVGRSKEQAADKINSSSLPSSSFIFSSLSSPSATTQSLPHGAVPKFPAPSAESPPLSLSSSFSPPFTSAPLSNLSFSLTSPSSPSHKQISSPLQLLGDGIFSPSSPSVSRNSIFDQFASQLGSSPSHLRNLIDINNLNSNMNTNSGNNKIYSTERGISNRIENGRGGGIERGSGIERDLFERNIDLMGFTSIDSESDDILNSSSGLSFGIGSNSRSSLSPTSGEGSLRIASVHSPSIIGGGIREEIVRGRGRGRGSECEGGVVLMPQVIYEDAELHQLKMKEINQQLGSKISAVNKSASASTSASASASTGMTMPSSSSSSPVSSFVSSNSVAASTSSLGSTPATIQPPLLEYKKSIFDFQVVNSASNANSDSNPNTKAKAAPNHLYAPSSLAEGLKDDEGNIYPLTIITTPPLSTLQQTAFAKQPFYSLPTVDANGSLNEANNASSAADSTTASSSQSKQTSQDNMSSSLPSSLSPSSAAVSASNSISSFFPGFKPLLQRPNAINNIPNQNAGERANELSNADPFSASSSSDAHLPSFPSYSSSSSSFSSASPQTLSQALSQALSLNYNDFDHNMPHAQAFSPIFSNQTNNYSSVNSNMNANANTNLNGTESKRIGYPSSLSSTLSPLSSSSSSSSLAVNSESGDAFEGVVSDTSEVHLESETEILFRLVDSDDVNAAAPSKAQQEARLAATNSKIGLNFTLFSTLEPTVSPILASNAAASSIQLQSSSPSISTSPASTSTYSATTSFSYSNINSISSVATATSSSNIFTSNGADCRDRWIGQLGGVEDETRQNQNGSLIPERGTNAADSMEIEEHKKNITRRTDADTRIKDDGLNTNNNSEISILDEADVLIVSVNRSMQRNSKTNESEATHLSEGVEADSTLPSSSMSTSQTHFELPTFQHPMNEQRVQAMQNAQNPQIVSNLPALHNEESKQSQTTEKKKEGAELKRHSGSFGWSSIASLIGISKDKKEEADGKTKKSLSSEKHKRNGGGSNRTSKKTTFEEEREHTDGEDVTEEVEEGDDEVDMEDEEEVKEEDEEGNNSDDESEEFMIVDRHSPVELFGDTELVSHVVKLGEMEAHPEGATGKDKKQPKHDERFDSFEESTDDEAGEEHIADSIDFCSSDFHSSSSKESATEENAVGRSSFSVSGADSFGETDIFAADGINANSLSLLQPCSMNYLLSSPYSQSSSWNVSAFSPPRMASRSNSNGINSCGISSSNIIGHASGSPSFGVHSPGTSTFTGEQLSGGAQLPADNSPISDTNPCNLPAFSILPPLPRSSKADSAAPSPSVSTPNQ